MAASRENEGDIGFLAPLPVGPVEPLQEHPSFSVVIPAYQASATVGEAVRSALSQSPAPLEAIVVDDGSNDELVAALEPHLAEIRLLRQEHAGAAAARNLGCRAAAGDFVVMLDADDILLPDKLGALSRLGRARPDLDVLCTDLYFEMHGERVGRFGEANPFPTQRQRTAILERCFAVQPAVRRSRLLGVGGFDAGLNTAEDWDLLLRLVLDGSLVGFHDEPLAVYRLQPGSLTDARAGALRDRARMLEKARDDPSLREEERPVLERQIHWRRSEALREEAFAVLHLGRSRRRLLRLVASPNVDLRARAIAGLGAVAPSAARRLLADRARPRT